MNTCNKCNEHELQFSRNYAPDEFIEGKLSSQVWIVGLNPKDDGAGPDTRFATDLAGHFDTSPFHSYFRDFRTVSELLYGQLGQEGGTAHTDIVKCMSKSFPGGKAGREIVMNCKQYLMAQIEKYKPKLIVCNGTAVSEFMKEFITPPDGTKEDATSYWAALNGARVCVVLSGFIGRIDNHAKRRLGAEIERRLAEMDSSA